MDFYEFVRGPMAWITFGVCIGASILRAVILLGRGRRTHRLHPANSICGGLKSILRGLLPFGLRAMRQQPLFSLVTFVFHLCVLLTPLFLLAHIVLWYESWQIQWISLPDRLADIMTGVVIAGTIFFAVRRFRRMEVRSLTGISDWMPLIVINTVFLTGMAASHHWGPYRPLLITHILLGEVFLLMIPFTKMFHMLLFFFTRGYLGAEYEIVMDGEGI